ncbi:MAG TPA: P27 family phage terminase small subunit [Planctomycetaceae bacterium]|jgi:phage terminase small subunit
MSPKLSKLIPRPPRKLTGEPLKLWDDIATGWQLDAPGLAVLAQACESLALLRAAEKKLASQGLTVKDRFKQDKANPLVIVVRDLRSSHLRALKQLQLAGEK